MDNNSKKSAELISIGTELLLGNILNTNAKYILCVFGRVRGGSLILSG